MWGGTDDILAVLSKKLECGGKQTSNTDSKTDSNSKINKFGNKEHHVKLRDSCRIQKHKQNATQGSSRSNIMAARPSEIAGELHSADIAHQRATVGRKQQLQKQESYGGRFESLEFSYRHTNHGVHMNSKHKIVKPKVEHQHSMNQKLSNEKKDIKASQSSDGGKNIQEKSNQDRGGLFANVIPQKAAEHRHKHYSGRKQDSGKHSHKNCEQNFVSRRQHIQKMSDHYLKDLSEKSPVDITFILEKDSAEFEHLLQSRDIKGDIMFLIVAVLSKVCAAELVHLKSSVLSVACKPDFLDELKKYIVVQLPKLKSQEEIINFCENSLIFFNTVSKLFSVSVCGNIKKLLLPMLNTMVEIEENFKENAVYKNIYEEMKTLLNQVSSASEVLSSNNTSNSNQTRKDKLLDLYESNFDCQPRDDFRTISHLPTAKEILSCNHGIVYRNVVKGSYRNVEHYLEVQYRLLREDFVGPLRSGIQEYIDSLMEEVGRKKRRINNVRIYPRVKFLNSTVKENKFGFLINYDLAKQFVKVKWEYSKRFIYGSLLLFTTDNFKSFFLAKVLERDIDTLKKGELYIEIAPEAKLPGNLMSQEFVMAESEIYFEPYYHVLIALQSISENNFPMKRYIINAEKDALLPMYLNDAVRMYKIGNHLMKIGNNLGNGIGWDPAVYDDDDKNYYYSEGDFNWPSAEDLSLDISQYAAFKAALTSEFVAIQGPPGTGKTFLGLKIAETFLNNLSNDLFPILVVCYTNHALDQFLEGILQYTESIVRIGGRSQNETLNKFNLRNMRINYRFKDHFKDKRFFLTRKTLDALRETLSGIISLESMLQKKMFDGILSIETFKGIMNTKQYEKLECCFVEWLMEGSCEFYIPSRNEMLQQDSSEQVDNIETEGDSIQTENPLTEGGETVNNEKVNLEVVTEGIVAINIGDKENELEEEEEEDEDETSKLRKNESCIDFEPEILLNPFLVNAKQPALCFKLSDCYNEIQNLRSRLTYISELANNEYGESFFYMADTTLINEYLSKQQRLREIDIACNYLCKRLNERINFKIVSERQLFNVDVFNLNSNERWALYHWWLQRLFDSYSIKVKELEEEYRKLYLKHSELRQLEDVVLLKDVKVIGMTTSGAANRRTMLENLGTRIVIVEEAAEVLEAHIVAALTKKCEQVILIGDHQQLRPSTAVYELAKHYHLDVSLFERMLKNGLNCHTLGTQHRMRPEIASLIVPAIYPLLENHSSVHTRTNIIGVTSNLYFITHTHFEDEVVERQSKMNRYEGDFLIRLCKHLLYQGYTGDEITILVTYSGQMMYLRKKKRDDPMLKNVRITVVDNFQGEENKIILLSLVRSNAMARIGFLATENRVCVALSRARDGLYIIGNMDNLTESSSIWKKIKIQLENMNALGCLLFPILVHVGVNRRWLKMGTYIRLAPETCTKIGKSPALTLQCVNHKKTLRVSCADDFKSSPEGGCTEQCDAHLPCGHRCQRKCHVLGSDHSSNENCTQPCERFCMRGLHKCKKMCYKECGECQINVEYVLECKHKNSIPCHNDPLEYKCLYMVTVSLPLCGHENDKLCHLDINQVKCKSSCEDRLPCGHSCVWKCHKKKDPDHIQYKCSKPCTKKSINCTKNHTCAKMCHEECGMCVVKRLKELPCGHMLKMECSADVCSVKCKMRCTKLLPCGHPCTNICSDPCGECQKQVTKVLPECGHEVKALCSVEPQRSACKAKCERTLKCGHKCMRMCKEDCDESKCREMVESCEMPTCCHPLVMVPCCENKKGVLFQCILEQYCKQPCKALRDCGHECTGDCSSCMQGRIHVPCTVKREKTLICGHMYTLECNENSTYCGKKCLYECHHSKCDNKCGQQCQQCHKRCDWTCEHHKCTKKCFETCDRKPCNEPCTNLLACEHPCIGFCGEVCPELCRVCDKEKLEKIFAGFQKKPNARFIVLEDCKHCVESEELENYLKIQKDNSNENKGIFLKTCPICLTPINKTRRYCNEVKMFYQQLVKLREKVFDDNKELENLRKQLSSTLQDISKVQSPAQAFVHQLASDKITQGKKSAVQAEMLAKCFISELLILLSEKYKLLMMVGKINEVMRDSIAVKLRVIITTMKKRLNRVGVYEMINISNEVHRVLRLMEFVILMNMRLKYDPLSNSDMAMLSVSKYGFGNVMFSINHYSLRDDDRMQALLLRINEDCVPATLRISVVSKYKVCISQMKCVNLCEVQWFMCNRGHAYIMRTFDDVVLKCECNQNDEAKIEILMSMENLAQNHRNYNFNDNNKQRSLSSSVVSKGSSKFHGEDSFFGSNENLKTQQKKEHQSRITNSVLGPNHPNSRHNEFRKQETVNAMQSENGWSQFPESGSRGSGHGYSQRGRARGGNVNLTKNMYRNGDEIPSLLDLPFASPTRGNQNQRSWRGKRGKARGRGQRN